MPILEYLCDKDFEFIDRVGFSSNNQVSRTVCFNRVMGSNSSSGLVTFFKEGSVSYKLINVELVSKETYKRNAHRVSVHQLEQRMTDAFG